MLHGTAHGAELLDKALSAAAQDSCDYAGKFTSSVAGYLQDQRLAQKADAADVTFVLELASKGLLLKTRTPEEFSALLSRVLRTLLHAPKGPRISTL